MKLNDIVNEAEKTRLDPKCWTGKKIGNPKTKVKGGVRVNNCVPAESVEEGEMPKTWHDVDKKLGKATDKMSQAEKVKKGLAHPDTLKKQGVAEGSSTTWEVSYDYGPHMTKTVTVKASSEDEARAKVEKAAEKKGLDIMINSVEPAEQGVAEGYDAEYDDEAGMADNNLETLARAVEGIDDLIQSGDNLPEWCQEKIAVAKSMLVAVWDYMESEENSEEVDPEVDEMFEAMESLVEEIAIRDQVDADLVWESFESLDDHMLYETAAWRRKEGKSKSGGLNAKGVASYRKENPGSKLQTAVTTKPSKLKKGSKAAKRRKSFCARMSGVKGPMKKPNGKPTRKALALRKWNC